MNTTPRLHQDLSPMAQKGSLSPYGSPTNQFKNPWQQQRSPAVYPQFQMQQSGPLPPPTSQQSLLTPTRGQFNSQLPTTYEYESMSQDRSRKSSLVQHPQRAPAPPPMYLSDDNVCLNDIQRRQSVAAVQTHQNVPQLQPQHFNRRPSMAPQYALKQLPPPQARPVLSKNDLKPVINKTPKFRRASMASTYISPLLALTTEICTTYTLCNSDFHYEMSKNPKRVLTKPSEGKSNDGFDNEEGDYILYVNDVLGVQENKKYLVLDILGHGTFAQVVKCQDLTTKELVAVKVVKSKYAFTHQSLNEVALLEFINKKVDPNDQYHLLRLKDKFLHKSHLCIVFELLSSNLFELVKQNQYKGLNTGLVRKFTKQLLESLCVLKRAEIIHCDLKPENILLISPDKPDIKIVDFGSACKEHQTLYTYVQSRFYRSPEVILGLPYSTSIDAWSLGCIVGELFLGLPLFPGSSEYDQMRKIVAILGEPPSWMIDMGKNAKAFFEKNEDTGGYKLKSLETYCEEKKVQEKPGDKFFHSDDLDELVLKYHMNRKAMTSTMIEKENNDRQALVHLLRGLLNLSPLQRWTPQQAILHPFITGEKFMGKWSPPGYTEV
jgi:dual specificity protein kinase YAK1